MNTLVDPDVAARTRGQRFMQFPLTRMVLAIFITALAGGLSLTYLGKLAHEWGGRMWPEFLAASIALLAYGLYVRMFERRRVTELSSARVLLELSAGLLTGAALVACVAVLVAALGSYRIVGMNEWTMSLLAPLAMMTFVGVFEEIISRGIVFRIAEKSLVRRRIHADAKAMAGYWHPHRLELHARIDLLGCSFWSGSQRAIRRKIIGLRLTYGWRIRLRGVTCDLDCPWTPCGVSTASSADKGPPRCAGLATLKRAMHSDLISDERPVSAA